MRAIIAEQLGTDLKKVEPASKFVDLGADSLDTVEIMMALEEKFDLQLDEEVCHALVCCMQEIRSGCLPCAACASVGISNLWLFNRLHHEKITPYAHVMLQGAEKIGTVQVSVLSLTHCAPADRQLRGALVFDAATKAYAEGCLPG